MRDDEFSRVALERYFDDGCPNVAQESDNSVPGQQEHDDASAPG